MRSSPRPPRRFASRGCGVCLLRGWCRLARGSSQPTCWAAMAAVSVGGTGSPGHWSFPSLRWPTTRGPCISSRQCGGCGARGGRSTWSWPAPCWSRSGATWRQCRPASDGLLHVLGSIEETEKRDMFAAADLFAMPSRTDSFGIVYLEAWLYRKPVIAARTWGVSDVVADGEDGLLVRFGDVPALAEVIASLLDDPTRRNALGARRGGKSVSFAYVGREVCFGARSLSRPG